MMTDEEIAAYIDAACALHRLVLSAQERAEVIAQFGRLAGIAAPLLDVALPVSAEMAPVFRA
jgi:hypothetical protein